MKYIVLVGLPYSLFSHRCRSVMLFFVLCYACCLLMSMMRN